MLVTLAIVAPVFIIIGAGWLLVKTGRFPEAGIDPLMIFVNRVATPCLLFNAIYHIDLGRDMDARLIGAYYLAALLCFIAGCVLFWKLFKRRPGEAVAAGFANTFGNSVLLGIPLTLRAYGDAAAGPLYALISVHALTIYTMGMVTMETVSRDGAGPLAALKKAGQSLIGSALIIGILSGFAGNLLRIPIPDALDDATQMLGRAALPAGLFAVGAALTRYRIRAEAAQALASVFVKIVLFPLLALVLCLFVFHVPTEATRVAVLIAAMPGGLNIYIFATLYHRSEALAASAMLLGTVLSVVTIPLWLGLLSKI